MRIFDGVFATLGQILNPISTESDFNGFPGVLKVWGSQLVGSRPCGLMALFRFIRLDSSKV
jgi:hypothetical protein